MAKVALLCAGGTGGHVFPAESLAHELAGRGWSVHLATDERAERFAGKFASSAVHVVPSATVASKNPIALIKTGMKLFSGFRAAGSLLRKLKPSVVIGFGGYPTLPPVYAAVRAGVPTVIHEQNAVMGRANAELARSVNAIAGGFLPEQGAVYPDKTILTGNPVRPPVIEAAKTNYAAPNAGPFRLLVFGGSQGGGGYWSFTLFDSNIDPGYGTVVAFGEGQNGDLFLVDHQNGNIWRFDSAASDLIFANGFD